MLTLTLIQIKEIADSIDGDLRCFIDPETGEIAYWPDFNSDSSFEDEYFDYVPEDEREEEEERYKRAQEEWLEIPGMESRESYTVMLDFAESVKNAGVRARLIQALEGKKPFANFKWQVDNSGDYRRHWFDYRLLRMMEWVEGYARREGIEIAG